MNARSVLAVVGTALAAVGLALLAGGSTSVPVSVPYAIVAPVLAGAVAAAGFHLLGPVTVTRDRWQPTATERSYRVPAPGDDLSELSARERRERLRRRVVRTLVDRRDCSRDEAVERVEAGTWTDDDVAADYLAGAYQPSLPERMAATVRDDPESRALRRTVQALREVRER